MSTINYTYNVIVDRFRQFAAGHFQLRRFTHGEISQADLEKEAEWPWLHVKPRAINYSPGTRSFSFEIFISDLPRDKEDKTGYQAESITDCSLIFQDLINEIYLGNMFGSDVVLTRPVNAEPFVEQYTHTLTGVTGTIELNLDYDWSACSIPASWNYNTPTDSPSDGWGALQFIESLDQNGVFVSLLNDVEAPGNSYYYGTNASGVKGWYAIVDNVGLTCETLPDCATIISIVDDIAALESGKVDKVAGKGLSTEDYTTAEKSKLAGIQAGAEVNVNADWNAVSGDAQILNKPTIPAAQVNSDWNATSGVAEILNKPTIPSIAGLVPETRTLTINGTTQDLSADRTFTIATGLTVGTTPITSGTVGRVLFEGTGNVLQESANFFWDNTNSRLGIGTSSPSQALQVNGNSIVFGNASYLGTFPFVELKPTAWSGQSTYIQAGVDPLGSVAGSYCAFLNVNVSRGFTFVQGSSSSMAITPTTRNVLIGTTTDAGFKLDVNGTGRFASDLRVNGLTVGRGGSSVDGNTAVGFEAALNNTTGYITAFGYQAGKANTTANDNVAFGYGALRTNSTGSFCLAFGTFALRDNTAPNNVAIGTPALLSNTTGQQNCALGNNSLRLNLTGSNNTAVGNNALRTSTVNNNVAIGYGAGWNDGTNANTTGANNIFIGVNSIGVSATESNRTWIGNSSTTTTWLGGSLLIGTTTDVASSILTLVSTTKGFLPPRMTNAQRLAIASPAVGLIVYCTDAVEGLYVNKSTGWTFVI